MSLCNQFSGEKMFKFSVVFGLIAAAAAQQCGVPAIPPTHVDGTKGGDQGRIVGGVEANPHSWPWMAALLKNGNFQFCGGSLIAPQWVMTAGHCFYGADTTPGIYTVKLGAHDDSKPETGMQFNAKVQKIFVNPKFNPRTISNDITLLKLTAPVTYTNYISPVCLPSSSDSDDPAGTNGVCTGWGATREGGSTVNKLMQVVLPIVDHGVCTQEYQGFGGAKVDGTMICAGLENGGKDSCQGDSGGPFVFNRNGKWVQTGIVSWGKGCAEAGYAGVYGRVQSFLDFIQTTMANNP